MNLLSSQKGQAILEGLWVLPLIISTVSGIIVLTYLLICHKFMSHWSYEAAICLSKQYKKSFCLTRFQESMGYLPQVSLSSLRVEQNLYQVRFSGKGKFGVFPWKNFYLNFKLPLEEQ